MNFSVMQSNSSLNFCASIKLNSRARTAANKLIKEYKRTSSEESKLKLLDIFEKHVETAAKNRDINASYKQDYKQELLLGLLTKLEEFKRSTPNPSFLLISQLNKIKPPKYLFDEMVRLDQMSEAEKENL